MTQSLFGTDGIRCRYGDEPLTPATIQRIGRAVAQVLRNLRLESRAKASPRVLIGRDTRSSGSAILEALAKGLHEGGLEPCDLGVISTPGVAYCVRNLGASAGMVISASHNPAHDNGIKLFGPDGFKLADELEAEISAEVCATTGDAPPAAETGVLRDIRGHATAYLEHLIAAGQALGHGDQPLAGRKIVVDAANGAASAMAPALFRALGAEVVEVACSPDGLNINENCGALHPETLIERVRAEKADGGVTLDGDGDRLMLIDEEGRVLDGDVLMAILAERLKAEGRLAGNCVVATVMSNLGLELALRKMDIELVRTPVGDRHVVAAMLQRDAVLGGEQSGHILYLSRGSTTGDGMFCAVNVLVTSLANGGSLGRHAGVMQRVPQILINVKVREKPPLAQLGAGVQDAWRSAEAALGIEGRILLRYSGTEPKARVMVEGTSLELIQHHAQAIADAIRAEVGLQQ